MSNAAQVPGGTRRRIAVRNTANLAPDLTTVEPTSEDPSTLTGQMREHF